MNRKSRHDPRVDAYIAKSAEFAKPILEFLRKTVHCACPKVEETIKWSFPNFTYKGSFCSMAAFKEHCSFGFWKAALILPKSFDKNDEGMGNFGRITSIKDLPSQRQLIAFIKAAKKLNDEGIKSPVMTNRKKRKPLPTPKELASALNKNKSAKTTFDNFSPTNRRDYIEWITEAKTDDTRQQRLATTIEWLAEGKPRNWKYMKR